MKNLKNLRGAKVLSKEEQQVLKGGVRYCDIYNPCGPGMECIGGICWLSRPGWYEGD